MAQALSESASGASMRASLLLGVSTVVCGSSSSLMASTTSSSASMLPLPVASTGSVTTGISG